MTTRQASRAMRTRLLTYASLLDTTPLQIGMRRQAYQFLAELQDIDWPDSVEPAAVRSLKDELFSVGYRANLGAGPLTETARRVRVLLDLVVPDEAPDPAADCAVLTPEEAARYLGLDRLGVSQPANRVRYLVKTKRVRPSYILGRLAFQRSDLDEYLVRHTR